MCHELCVSPLQEGHAIQHRIDPWEEKETALIVLASYVQLLKRVLAGVVYGLCSPL